MKEFAHPAFSTVSVVGSIGPLFFFAALMFSFVIQISAVVTEREIRLRQAMSTMGLPDSVFWVTWLLWEIILNFFSALLLSIFGMIFQFDFFLKNDFGTHFVLFFLFEICMTGFAFFLSTFMSKGSSATTLGFVFFLFFFILWFVVGQFRFPYGQYSILEPYISVIFSFIPPNLLTKAMLDLGDATAASDSKGIKWNNIYNYCGDLFDCDPLYSIVPHLCFYLTDLRVVSTTGSSAYFFSTLALPCTLTTLSPTLRG